MNTDALEWALMKAERRVLKIQTKLHQWAAEGSGRQFDDVFNLVCDPAFLLVAWARVRRNKGARTAGVDGQTAYYIEHRGVEVFLDSLRADMKSGEFRPLPVRERMIPKPGTSRHRRLGIPTVRDRVVQAALKLVLEPIWETDFLPCSYGFRPGRRAHDAVAEIRIFASPPHRYEWAVEGDITACFDEISHSALLERVRERVTDRRVVRLIKAFLRPESSRRTGDSRTPPLGPRRAGSCLRCCRTSRSVFSMSISLHLAKHQASTADGRGRCLTGSSVTPMTGCCWCVAPEQMPRASGTRQQRFYPLWAFAFRRRRRRSSTSTRASTFSDGASSATGSEVLIAAMSTPTPARRR